MEETQATPVKHAILAMKRLEELDFLHDNEKHKEKEMNTERNIDDAEERTKHESSNDLVHIIQTQLIQQTMKQ